MVKSWALLDSLGRTAVCHWCHWRQISFCDRECWKGFSWAAAVGRTPRSFLQLCCCLSQHTGWWISELYHTFQSVPVSFCRSAEMWCDPDITYLKGKALYFYCSLPTDRKGIFKLQPDYFVLWILETSECYSCVFPWSARNSSLGTLRRISIFSCRQFYKELLILTPRVECQKYGKCLDCMVGCGVVFFSVISSWDHVILSC